MHEKIAVMMAAAPGARLVVELDRSATDMAVALESS
jgi:hypothetical protein